MIDKHDFNTFDWVDTVCDNTQQNSTKQSETKENLLTNDNTATPVAVKELNMNVQTIAEEVNNIKAPSIQSSACLVTLNRSVPSMMKEDKDAARALANLKNADPKAVGAKKKLIACSIHEALVSTSNAMYRYHAKHTLPWTEKGPRLLTNAVKLDYMPTMEEFMKQFYSLKDQFLEDGYPAAVGRAQLRLGDLFDEALFPTVYELERKIGVRLNYEIIADPEHHVVRTGDLAAQTMRDSCIELFERRLASAYNDIFERLKPFLTNMSEMLDYDEEDKPTGFRDTLVTNITDVLGLADAWNITADPDLTRITRELQTTLGSVTPDSLRNSVTQRMETKAKVDKIINDIPVPTLDF